MLWILLSCGTGEKEPQMSGVELIESYHSAVCTLQSDSVCADALVECGEPLMQHADWASCMNDMTQITQHCGTLPAAVESYYDDLSACILELESIDCHNDSVCKSGTTVIRAEPCELMLSLIAQECM